jgi:GT2 family glycosyltransferase
VNLTIVTPWLAHPELADDYVDAVVPELQPGDHVLIIDNGDAPDLPFKTLTPTRNLGFAKASNLGLHHATTDAILFLNNDIRLGARGWLNQLRDTLEPGVLAGPVRYDPHSNVDGTACPYVDGWCLAGTRADLAALGGFDERLTEPAYYSDNLLCLEARARGMTLRDVRVRLHHKESRTSRPATNPQVQQASARNRALYLDRARQLLIPA